MTHSLSCSGYGHDNSMYAFMLNGGFMLCLAAAGFFGALIKVPSAFPPHCGRTKR